MVNTIAANRIPLQTKQNGLAIVWLILCALHLHLLFNPNQLSASETWIGIPAEDVNLAVQVRGNTAWRWTEGSYEVLHLVGDCRISQGKRTATAPSMMIWIEAGDRQEDRPTRIVAYLENGAEVTVEQAATPERLRDRTWLGRFVTSMPLDVHAPNYMGQPEIRPAIYQRMLDAHAAGDHLPVIAAQFQVPMAEVVPSVPSVAAPQTGPATPEGVKFQLGAQSIEIASRGSRLGARIGTTNRTETGESVVIASGGVTIIIRDVTAVPSPGQILDLGAVTLSADRIVGWLPIFGGERGIGDGEGELYLEGDIVFRQGERIIYANRMYYNIRRNYGVVLQAEVLTPLPFSDGVAGFVRLKAEVLQQLSSDELVAYGAAVTTSRLGVPRYWLQSGEIRVRNQSGAAIDPATGTMVPVQRSPKLRSENNLVYLAGVPVFYWPTLATSLEKRSFYVTGLKMKSDSVFGRQFMVDFDVHQLLGWENAPDGTEWKLSTDYLSERGPALGTQYTYELPGLFGLPGPATGALDVWGIRDDGLDTLGIDRRKLEPEKNFRGRVLLHHRHYLPYDTEFWADVGYLSDRNFLEQYLENEWDQYPDQTTGLKLRRYALNQMVDLSGQVRVNDFATQTNWLPRVDHYLLGGSLLDDWLTWTAHTNVGYAKLETATTPLNPVEAAVFQPAPWEVEREGLRAATRHELAVPLELGPIKTVPFISGEAAYWGETINDQHTTRLTGQAGIRTSLPMWAAYPNVVSPLMNVNGLAHKVEWRGDVLFAESNYSLQNLPLYDPLNDDSQEHFRRRFPINTFGGILPPQFDERSYALRHALQGWVTSPSTEVAGDLFVGRLGLHQRLQTKRGLIGRERIVDLLQLDVDMMLYPKQDRDNFGKVAGPLTYDYRYHIGDRLSFLSDGYFDFFDSGLRSISSGILWNRPGLGNVYLGLLSLEGPISSSTATGSVNYRLDDKWIVNASAALDLSEARNIGQQLSLIRVGESVLLRLGIAVDQGRDNVGFQFGIEPRVWPKRKLGRLGGMPLPPPGVDGLE